MAGAAETAVANSRLNLSAVSELGGIVTSVFDRATKERQIQTDILQGMVLAEHNYQQQRVDEWYKGASLKLREKEIANENIYKNIQVGQASARLGLAERQLKLDEDKFALMEQKVNDAEKHKEYLNGLSDQSARLKNDINDENKAIEFESKSLQSQLNGSPKTATSPGSRGMNSYERWKDSQLPDGVQAKLRALTTTRYKALEEKRVKAEKLDLEYLNVSRGGTPGMVLPLPPLTPSKNTTNPDNILLPNAVWEAEGVTDDDKAALRLDDERREGKLPVDTYQNDMSIDDEDRAWFEAYKARPPKEEPYYEDVKKEWSNRHPENIIKAKDQEVLGIIFSPGTPIEEASLFYNELSPNGKLELLKSKNKSAVGILIDYGRAKSYDYTKKTPSENEESIKNLTNRFIRAGGNDLELTTFLGEAEEKLIDLRSEAMSNAELDDESKIDKFVAKSYNEWASNKYKAEEEAIAKSQESDVMKGFGAIINPTGEVVPGFKNVLANPSEKEKEAGYNSLLEKYTINTKLKERIDSQNNEEALAEDFRKAFIDLGEKSKNPGFNNLKFAEFGMENEGIMNAVLGDDFENYFYSDDGSGSGYNKEEAMIVRNKNIKKFIEKTKTLSAWDAYPIWKANKKKNTK